MSNIHFISKLLMPFGPRLPLEQMTEEVNRLYHAAEAETYDSRHPEIFAQLPPIWEEMVQLITKDHPDKCWDILDFGCGTGFASQQVLRLLPAGNVRSLTCFDPSPEMLNRCRTKLGLNRARFLTEFPPLQQRPVRFNLVITNSLLHHLANPLDTIGKLSGLLTHDALWLAGHEPSRRLYENGQCLSMFNRYMKTRKLSRLLSPAAYFNVLGRFVGLDTSPASLAARQAYRRGFFDRKPSVRAITRLVDFHVAHSSSEARAGRGFDIDELVKSLDGSWELRWFKSYSYIGYVSESRLSGFYARRYRRLAELFPRDGSNFCSIWSIKPSATGE